MKRERRKLPRTFRQRLDEVLVDPSAPKGEWSSTRVFLAVMIVNFNLLAIVSPTFRDSGAFVTVILALLTAVVVPKALDLRVAIGQAAASIGRRFTKREETTETTEVTDAPPVDPEAPVERQGE